MANDGFNATPLAAHLNIDTLSHSLFMVCPSWVERLIMDFELLLLLVQLHNAQAFSLHFLLFDVYRPDHPAYAFILLQTFLAIKRKFVPLLMATILASQAREFNIIPLLPYLFMIIPDENRTILIRQDVLSTIFFLPTILLPRILTPITMYYQIVGLSTQGIFTAILLPLIPGVELNFLFVIVAYFLPSFSLKI